MVVSLFVSPLPFLLVLLVLVLMPLVPLLVLVLVLFLVPVPLGPIALLSQPISIQLTSPYSSELLIFYRQFFRIRVEIRINRQPVQPVLPTRFGGIVSSTPTFLLIDLQQRVDV
jgi:hypothetical protein